MSDAILIQTLTESFIALADEVQSLIDRKTILEHKLRYAHEQYQYLADKYAPAVPEISETLAKLQIPPELHPLVSSTTAVPLPIRTQGGSSQHQLALLIREGRKAARKLATEIELELPASPAMIEVMTAASTVLEKDFTVEGKKKGMLACPFSAPKQPNQDGGQGEPQPSSGAGRVDNSQDQAGIAAVLPDDPTPHKSSDPICAAMIEDIVSAPPAAAPKCPIRYLDKHSPEEIAHYVERHKHEIPRSHEVCVRRYQKNEEQIRKLDAKYGSLVSMVEDLSLLHRPMLPADAADPRASHVDNSSTKRVEDWAQTIVAGDPEQDNDDDVPLLAGERQGEDEDDEGRQGRFDRPLREVRVGESPSRPWGISVPAPKPGFKSDDKVTGSSPVPPLNPRLAAQMTTHITPQAKTDDKPESRKCPFDHTKMGGLLTRNNADGQHGPGNTSGGGFDRSSSPLKNDTRMPSSPPQATFVNLSDHIPPPAAAPTPGQGAEKKDDKPQIVFNISGPVFIGYPMEQAIQFMQQFQQQQQQQQQQGR